MGDLTQLSKMNYIFTYIYIYMKSHRDGGCDMSISMIFTKD